MQGIVGGLHFTTNPVGSQQKLDEVVAADTEEVDLVGTGTSPRKLQSRNLKNGMEK
jgi:hypothetical protein